MRAEVHASAAHRAWAEELARLTPHWQLGRRHHLTMGLSAYGLSGLKLDPGVVRAGLDQLTLTARDEERDARLQVFLHTLHRYQDGLRLAWHPYYARAGVAAPARHPGAAPDVVAALAVLRERLFALAWRGRSGLSARAVYAALLGTAAKYGVQHERGIAVSVSVRHLAEKAGVGKDTVMNAIRGDHLQALVVRAPAPPGTDAGTLILTCDWAEVPQADHSSVTATKATAPLGRVLSEWSESRTSHGFRWGPGKSGLLAQMIVTALLHEDRPLTKRELATAMHREPKSLRRSTLERFGSSGFGIITFDDLTACYRLADDWQTALARMAESTGAVATSERHRERHQREREAFRHVAHRMLIRERFDALDEAMAACVPQNPEEVDEEEWAACLRARDEVVDASDWNPLWEEGPDALP